MFVRTPKYEREFWEEKSLRNHYKPNRETTG